MTVKGNLFLKKELFSALKILDKNLIEKDLLTGSWAGAMGQSQFMPSSYLSYAVDFNKDKKSIFGKRIQMFLLL